MKWIQKNRNGEERSFDLNIKAKTLTITGNANYARYGYDKDNNITMYDFEGGPAITVGHRYKLKTKIITISSIYKEVLNGIVCKIDIEEKE